MAILAKTQKWYEGKSERGGGGCNNHPPLLRERGLIRSPEMSEKESTSFGQLLIEHSLSFHFNICVLTSNKNSLSSFLSVYYVLLLHSFFITTANC